MLKRHKRILSLLMALGLILAQCGIAFAEYSHPLHQPDSQCAVCLVAGHFSHALVNAGLTLNLAHYAPLHSDEAIVLLPTHFTVRYLIRAPPSVFTSL